MNIKKAKKLFAKYLNNECSPKELLMLETFLESYQRKEHSESDLKFSDEEIKSLWTKIETEITKKQKKKQYPFKSYIAYAAAASVILFISLTSILNKSQEQIAAPSIVESNIEIGTDKATLTLEDGSKVALEKGKGYKGNNLSSDGEELVYDTKEDQTISEIAYNYLTIPRGGQFFVQLSDGTKVWLNSESQLKYPVNFVSGKPRQVELVYGEAYFDVSHSTEHHGASFMVQSKGQNIEVLGTEFNVKAYKDEAQTYTTLVKGKIALETAGSKKVLKPGQQAAVNSDNGTQSLYFVDVYNETSWKNGIFSFKGKRFKEIAKVLSRWYDVDILFINKNLEEMAFNGVLGKDQSIDDILSAIQNGSQLELYEIKGKTIYVK